MSDSRRFEVNQNEVAAKVMDGEAIIMNIANGAYYSVTGSGALIWEELERGMSVDQVVDALTAVYDVQPDTARADTVGLVGTLLTEGLVIETDGREGPAPRAAGVTREPYPEPVFEKFTDMADMLALDPPMPGFDETPWAQTGQA